MLLAMILSAVAVRLPRRKANFCPKCRLRAISTSASLRQEASDVDRVMMPTQPFIERRIEVAIFPNYELISGKGGPYGKQSKKRVVPLSRRLQALLEPYFALNERWSAPGTKDCQTRPHLPERDAACAAPLSTLPDYVV